MTAVLALSASGCASIGPQRLGIDRTDYATRLRQTNKEQLLLNIVAMRYGDAPLFLEVSSVIAQYTREGSLHANAEISPPSDDPAGGVGADILLRETPTVTYTPLAGDRFARSMLAPLSPASLLAMIESGWSADTLLRLAARSINGVSSGSLSPMFAHRADPEFETVLGVIGRLQRDRAIVLHIAREGSKFTGTTHRDATLNKADLADLDLLGRLLKLPADRKGEYVITFGSTATEPDQIAIGTRSMFEILAEMAQGVEVPAKDLDRAVEPADSGSAPLIHVHSGDAAPTSAHVSVQYRHRWFWIDGSDDASKRMFLLAQVLMSLNDTSGTSNAPLVTIPTG